MKSAVFTTDIHLTDQKSEAYRFEMFTKLKVLIQERGLSYCFILGDITDKTDRHSSYLVNTLVDSIRDIAGICKVLILRGNHDCVDAANPYFRFLSGIPNIFYFKEPTRIRLDDTRLLMLPHSRDPETEWKGLGLEQADIICLHQTLSGSVSENGTGLEGLPAEVFAGCKELYSGDVHVPQKMGNLTYIGSPYHVHFGDNFEGRFLIRHEDGHVESIPTNMPRRLMLNLANASDFEVHGVRSHDQVKIRLSITPEQWPLWPEYQESFRRACEAVGAELIDAEPLMLGVKAAEAGTSTFLLNQQSSRAVLERFMKTKYPGMGPQFLEAGLDILKAVDGI